MRRFTLLVVLVAAACRTVPMSTSQGGAASPKAAIDRFIGAANAQDVQALLSAWGDEKGSRRERSSNKDQRTEDERAAIVLICHLKNTAYTIQDSNPIAGGRTIADVDISQGTNKARVRFTVARAPSAGFFVADFDIITLQHAGFCSQKKS